MNTNSKQWFWRATWVHRNGYLAPTYYVEAKRRKDAIKLAKERSRLASFPKQWYVYITKMFEEDLD